MKVKFTKALLNSYVGDFIEDEISDEKTKNTFNKYQKVVLKFIDFFQEEDITKNDVIKYKEMLLKNFKTKTVNNYIIIVNKFMKYVEMNELGLWGEKSIKKYESRWTLNPIKEQEKTSIENVLEPIEFKRMLKKAKEIGQEDTYMIMKIFGYTGIRLSELEFYTFENVENGRQYVEVYNKGKMRCVPLRADLRRELLKYAKKHGIEEGTLFPGAKSPKIMLTEKTIENRIKKICGLCRGIKLEKAHPHAFRHMFAIQWVKENGEASLSELAKILGHSDVKTTAIYTNTSQKEKKRKVEKIRY